MNLVDLLIIYLTCGAPFGVYYFFQTRNYSASLKLIFQSILIALFWIPYAIQLLHSFVTKRFRSNEFAENNQMDSAINEIERKFAQILHEENSEISVYEFRETFERYQGLTKAASTEVFETDAELYHITNHENKNLASEILSRRNRSRLNAHHILARKDFLRMIEKIDSTFSAKKKIRTLAFDFVKILNDVEAQKQLHKIFENPTQSDNGFTVNEMENEVWNPNETKQLPTPRKALNFRTISATATMLKRD
jgi:hypothetical protein